MIDKIIESVIMECTNREILVYNNKRCISVVKEKNVSLFNTRGQKSNDRRIEELLGRPSSLSRIIK